MVDPGQVSSALREWSEAFMRDQMTGFVRYTRECGLSMSQAGVLFHLHGHHHGHTPDHCETAGVSDIGSRLGVSNAAASQLLDRLVQQGLILRSEDPDDRRAKRISLTEDGRKVVEGGMKGRDRWLRALAEKMTDEERAAVLAGLEILIGKIGETVPDDEKRHPVDEKETSKK